MLVQIIPSQQILCTLTICEISSHTGEKTKAPDQEDNAEQADVRMTPQTNQRPENSIGVISQALVSPSSASSTSRVQQPAQNPVFDQPTKAIQRVRTREQIGDGVAIFVSSLPAFTITTPAF